MALRAPTWHLGGVTEYRAFDKKGVIVSSEDVTETDAAVAWGMGVALNGAVLVERRDGDEWVCFQEYHRSNGGNQRTDG
jgi:hypothetical protein